MELLTKTLSKMSTRIFFHWAMLLNMPILCLNVSTEAKQVMENIGIFQFYSIIVQNSSIEEKHTISLLIIYLQQTLCLFVGLTSPSL